MAVDTKHPDYIDHLPEWQLMRDAERGPLAVRDAGIAYLPMPSGFLSQPDGGVAMYQAYGARARFPDIVAPTIRGMSGLVHRKEAQIELPPVMEPLREKCSADGLTLDAFHQFITQELLRTGRFGVLAEASVEGSDLPYLAGYTTEAIINWSYEGDFFVLDESGPVREGFNWRQQDQYRVLEMVDGSYVQRVYLGKTADTEGEEIRPAARGNGTLAGIPFVVANPIEVSTVIGQIPLIGVARASVAIYQLDADYRHQLFMSGQETFVTIGVQEPPTYVGASVRLALPEGGDAKYVGPAGTGIEAHRQAIEDAKEDAVASGSQLFDQQSGEESGEALRLRYGGQTATLYGIAKTSASVLERSLRNIAAFMNANPELVVVKPNLRFVEAVMKPADAQALMQVWMGGAISKPTLFENLQRGDIIPEDRTFEEEEQLIEADEMDRADKANEEMERQRQLQGGEEEEDDEKPPGNKKPPPKSTGAEE